MDKDIIYPHDLQVCFLFPSKDTPQVSVSFITILKVVVLELKLASPFLTVH